MENRYLFGTTVPVLLDGRRQAGRLARMLYVNFGLESHWFGARGHILLSIYARKHPTLPFSPDHDAVNLRIIKDFARERRVSTGIHALIPCSPEAEVFLGRVGHELEEDFVFLHNPEAEENPLLGLIRSNHTKELP